MGISEVNELSELLNEHLALSKTVQCENISIEIYVLCNSIHKCQELWCIVSGIDILLEQSKNDNPTCKKQDLTSHTSFFQ